MLGQVAGKFPVLLERFVAGCPAQAGQLHQLFGSQISRQLPPAAFKQRVQIIQAHRAPLLAVAVEGIPIEISDWNEQAVAPLPRCVFAQRAIVVFAAGPDDPAIGRLVTGMERRPTPPRILRVLRARHGFGDGGSKRFAPVYRL